MCLIQQKVNDVRNPVHPLLGVMGLVAVGLAGCSSTSTPPSPALPSSSIGKTLPSHGAPAVVTPITGTTAVESDPCAAVTPKQDGTLTSFTPLPPIDGYPAVSYAQGGEGEGVCTLAIGVRDDLLYTVIARLDTGNPHRSDPCGVAAKIGSFGIEYLKSTHPA